MRTLLFLAAASLCLGFAGCTGPANVPDVATIFADDVDTNATAGPLLVRGHHVEGQVGDGPWGAAGNVTVEAGAVEGPRMSGPNALGGGGETTTLALPANASVPLAVRLPLAAELAGYTANYYLVRGKAPADLGNLTPTASLDASEEFRTTVTEPGAFAIHVSLLRDGETAAILQQPFRGQVIYHWTLSGEVQPQKPSDPGAGTPVWPTPRDDMVDKYAFTLAGPAMVTATTAFNGAFTPAYGTDVDLGLYSPDGEGVACAAGSLDPASAVDPVQASETLTADATSAGTWTVEVGAMMDGCGGSGAYSYGNAGPVPYTLDLLVG